MTAALPALFAIYLDGTKRSRSIISEAREEQLRLTQAIAFQHEAQTQGLRQLLAAFVHTPEVQRLDVATSNRMFQESLKKNPTILNLSITDAHGVIIASGKPLPAWQVTMKESKVFKDAVSTADFSVGEYLSDPVCKQPTLHFSQPFYSPGDGALKGVLLASLDLTIFHQFCRNLKLVEGQTFNLSDHRGTLLQRFPKHATVVPGTEDRPELRAKVTGPDEEGTFFAEGRDGVQRLLGFKRMRLTADTAPYIYMRLTIPEQILVEQVSQERSRNLILLAVTTLLALLVAWLLGNRSIVRHIDKLADFARELPTRRGAAIVLEYPPHDIQQLGDALNYASFELERVETDLQAEQNRLKQALTEKMLTEMELQQLNQELEQRVVSEVERSREKDAILLQQARFAMLGEILMNISHQWRQPLNSIGLQVQEMTYLLGQGELSPEQAQELSGSIMQQLIDLSGTIERFRRLNQTGQRTDDTAMPIEAISSAVELVRNSLNDQGIQIHLHGHNEVPVHCSPADFSNCIINIINNARDAIIDSGISDGQIVIRADVDGNGKNRIVIFDNGTPIPENMLERIFDAYVTSKFQSQGVGLGLFIVRQTVEKVMKGTVKARNTSAGVEFVLEV
jgi:signal transduction histidine kinase